MSAIPLVPCKDLRFFAKVQVGQRCLYGGSGSSPRVRRNGFIVSLLARPPKRPGESHRCGEFGRVVAQTSAKRGVEHESLSQLPAQAAVEVHGGVALSREWGEGEYLGHKLQALRRLMVQRHAVMQDVVVRHLGTVACPGVADVEVRAS